MRALGPYRVFPIGFGAMNLSFGGAPPKEDAVRVVEAALDAGITCFDTADVYAPDASAIGHNERLLGGALAGADVCLATKGGVVRRGEDEWLHDGRPAYLEAACEASLRRLGREAIDLYYLHAVDERVPIEESVGALARLRERGWIRELGVSNVTLAQLERAAAVAPIVAVQNEASPYRPGWDEDGVLGWCEAHGAAFVAHSPMGGWRAGETSHLPELAAAAEARGLTPFQLLLVRLLERSEAVIPLPGASRPENVRASAAVVG